MAGLACCVGSLRRLVEVARHVCSSRLQNAQHTLSARGHKRSSEHMGSARQPVWSAHLCFLTVGLLRRFIASVRRGDSSRRLVAPAERTARAVSTRPQARARAGNGRGACSIRRPYLFRHRSGLIPDRHMARPCATEPPFRTLTVVHETSMTATTAQPAHSQLIRARPEPSPASHAQRSRCGCPCSSCAPP